MLLKEDYQIFPSGYPGRLSEEETAYIIQDLLNKGPNEAVAFLLECKDPYLRESLTTHYIKEWEFLVDQFSVNVSQKVAMAGFPLNRPAADQALFVRDGCVQQGMQLNPVGRDASR